jgi:hypothetical protein
MLQFDNTTGFASGKFSSVTKPISRGGTMNRLPFAILLIMAIGSIELTPAVKAKVGPNRSTVYLPGVNGWLPGNPDESLQESAGTVCAAGEAPSGDLGYSGTECHGCTISGKHLPGEPDMEFASEPILMDIRRGGPAEGKLEEKDVLVAIDNQPITTRAAAVQLSWLKPGKPVRLTVRRQGVVTDVEITPTARCRRITQERPRLIIIRRRVWQ